MITIPVLPNVEFSVPNGLAGIVELAYNLWWSWSTAGRDLWATIDPVGWEQTHNPIDLLLGIDRPRWAQIEHVEAVHERAREALVAFDRYLAADDTWYERHRAPLSGPVAYLSTEFGVHGSVPFYSGGLGILAGDHLKSASDLGVPLVGVGLLYRRGYFRQEIEADGDQQHFYPTLDLRRLPVRPVAALTGGQLRVTVELPGRDLCVAVWKLDAGRVPLLLLDTDVPENDPADRPISHTLYVRGREMRLCQELVLGVGAVRALDALGIDPSVWHVNEGHAALNIVERLAVRRETGEDLATAGEALRQRTVFTLHTPVPAGNEIFDADLAVSYLSPWIQRCGLDRTALLELAGGERTGGRFDLGALAIRFSSFVNGVSARHAGVVTRDWGDLVGGPAHGVTNGVHTPSWIGRSEARLLGADLGADWPVRLVEDPRLAERVCEIPGDRIWSAHQGRKEIFVRFARERLRRQFARHGLSPGELRAVEHILPADRLTLGFARRFATYKRATLMFRDLERLHSILTHPDRPVQVVFAGKAHPADDQGQVLIRRIVELSKRPELAGHVHVLEDYDARMARFLVQGVDVWVNNPRPPLEASGTSGMKAAINGTLNLSVIDGWWAEGYDGDNGWVFGRGEPWEDHGAADAGDAASFYDVLEHEVAPLFYDRDAGGIPQRWVERMRASIASSIARFSALRMVSEYFEQAYLPRGGV